MPPLSWYVITVIAARQPTTSTVFRRLALSEAVDPNIKLAFLLLLLVETTVNPNSRQKRTKINAVQGFEERERERERPTKAVQYETALP